MKRNKFNAIKTRGFDSKKEAKRADELYWLQEVGEIKDLRKQVTFEIHPKFRDNQGVLERSIKYIADFVYFDIKRQVTIVEDVKSSFTAKLPTYIIKRKLFKLKYPEYVFLEVIVGEK